MRKVDLGRLESELRALVSAAADQSIFHEPEFTHTPIILHRLNDIAFSGDGEPTTCPVFADGVELAARVKVELGGECVKLVLITDACYLDRAEVIRGLEVMDRSNGEIWAKLDAGTEEYYRLINRPNFPLAHVMKNITSTARIRPVVIQSLFMRVHDVGPSHDEIIAYCDRLIAVLDAGGRISLVQIYTVARVPAQPYVTPLTNAEVDAIADRVRQCVSVPVDSFYG